MDIPFQWKKPSAVFLGSVCVDQRGLRLLNIFNHTSLGRHVPWEQKRLHMHGLRACLEEHWMEENFTVLKVDMINAFNLVSHQSLLSECAKHFPSSTHGLTGVIASIHFCGTRWRI